MTKKYGLVTNKMSKKLYTRLLPNLIQNTNPELRFQE